MSWTKDRGVATGVAQAYDKASRSVEDRDMDAEANIEKAHRSPQEDAAREAASQTEAKKECIVCGTESRAHFVPCAHFCVCAGCCEDIMAKPAPMCPHCLCSAQAGLKVFRP